MLKSTIELSLQRKIESLATVHVDIADELFKGFIAGGSIVSLLTGTKVNDYDLYLDSIESAEKVYRYFLNLAGFSSHGTLERRSSTDIEGNSEERLFLDSSDGLKVVTDTKHYPVYFSDNAITLKGDVQIITRFSGAPEDVFRYFDFVHAQSYWSKETGLVVSPAAMNSIVTKQLHYNGSLYPVCSIIRMRKFLRRGWNISAGQIIKIARQCSLINWKDRDTLRDQILGVDMLYIREFLALIEKIDPDASEKEYLDRWNEILDEAFSEGDFDAN